MDGTEESVRNTTDPGSLLAAARLHRERGNPAGAAMLELAAALWAAAGPVPTAPWYRALVNRKDTPVQDDLSSRFAAWAEACGDVLAAMARSLAGTESSWSSGSVPVSGDSLPSVAERLIAETGFLNKALSRAAATLRSEGSELVRRAGEVGSLERSVQKEHGRLREELEKCTRLEAQLAGLVGERLRAAERVAVLQDRLRLAGGTAGERRSLEQRVADAEAAAARDRAENEELDRQLNAIEQERKELSKRLEQTRALVHDLELSPDRELSKRVQEIWRCLPPDAQARGTSLG